MISDFIANHATESESRLWTLGTGKQISYSDGATTEHYLARVLKSSSDLSSASRELDGRIRDWASEYHLSSARANLLRGFEFRPDCEVLEVGCGCGAISRFLGENLDFVLGIEGSLNRARLARLRTRDQGNVTILCAPFQELRFRKKFDIIFCIGVLEYSNVFVDADDPHDYMLERFRDILKEDGVLVLAIENQFGLKYFSASAEDHTNVMFDGIEGYPRYRNKAKTFGYDELKRRLHRHFETVDYSFPYPDYKLPECILSEKMLALAACGELVGNFRSRDYLVHRKPLFDERLAWLELQENARLNFFSNSFLVTARNGGPSPVRQNGLGAMFSRRRHREFQTVTRFDEDANGTIRVIKEPASGAARATAGKLTLHRCESSWVNNPSLQLRLLTGTKERNLDPQRLFSPCRVWLEAIQSSALEVNKEAHLPGRLIDHTWKNCFIHGRKCHFVDREWEWDETFPVKVLIIRSIYIFLDEACRLHDINRYFSGVSTKQTIRKIARHIGTELTNQDFRQFCRIESEFQSLVYGRSVNLNLLEHKLVLWNRSIHAGIGRIGRWLEIPPARLRQLIEKIPGIRQLYARRSP